MNEASINSTIFPHGMRTVLIVRKNTANAGSESVDMEFSIADVTTDSDETEIKGVSVGNDAIKIKGVYYNRLECEARYSRFKINGQTFNLGFESVYSLIAINDNKKLISGNVVSGEIKARKFDFNPKWAGAALVINDSLEPVQLEVDVNSVTVSQGETALLELSGLKPPPLRNNPFNIPAVVPLTFPYSTYIGWDNRLNSSSSWSARYDLFTILFFRSTSETRPHLSHTHHVTNFDAIDLFLNFNIGFNLDFYWQYFSPYFNSKLKSWPQS
jgi:hypothetical protein